MKYEIYSEIALSQIPRMLSLGDRTSYSESYGCFDRYFWHYQLIDFPNARLQEASLILAILYKNKFEGNIYFRNPSVKKWIKASLDYWSSIQLRDGSFNEAYPFEHSFVSTAFSTYAATESLRILNLNICQKTIERAGDWLIKESNYQVSNQVAGAIAALNNIFILTGKKKYKKNAEEKLRKLFSLQHKEGYFPEYGGWDVGYLSICLKYLSRYYQNNPSFLLEEAMKKAIKFIDKKTNRLGIYDNRGSSRDTQYLYPSSLAILGDKKLIMKNIKGLISNSILNPGWMDDRFFIPLTSDYLETYAILNQKRINK